MGVTASNESTAAIVPFREGASDRLLLYGGEELRSNSNQDVALRFDRLLIYGAGESGSKPSSSMEFERDRLLLYGAPDFCPLPPLCPCTVLPPTRLRMRGSPPILRIGVVTPILPVLFDAVAKVARMPIQPRLDVRLQSLRLARLGGARVLALLQARIDPKPAPAKPAWPPPRSRRHRLPLSSSTKPDEQGRQGMR
jgi:hypothetical protein